MNLVSKKVTIGWLDDGQQQKLLSEGCFFDSESAVHLLELPSKIKSPHLKYAKNTNKSKPRIRTVSFVEALRVTNAVPSVLRNMDPNYLKSAFNIIIKEKLNGSTKG